jgi:hypothetical protein
MYSPLPEACISSWFMTSVVTGSCATCRLKAHDSRCLITEQHKDMTKAASSQCVLHTMNMPRNINIVACSLQLNAAAASLICRSPVNSKSISNMA